MFSDTYRCRPCGQEFTHDYKGFWLGPLSTKLDRDTIEAFLTHHTQNFYCSSCQLELTIPSLLNRAAWIEWTTDHEPQYRRYPFLVKLVDRIEASFAGDPWRVDIGSISCPYCEKLLDSGSFQLACRSCGSNDVEHINQSHSQTRDYWPPIV